MQLLQSQLAGSSQATAPVPQPQDVHPQAYQAPGVGGPPAPQWGAPAPTGGLPPQAPGLPRQIADWNRGVGEMHQPHVLNGYDHRDGGRTLVSAAQQPSPRQEQIRATYHEPVRVPPAPRSPKAALTVSNASYPQSHAIPQLASTQGPPPPPPLERPPTAVSTTASASYVPSARVPVVSAAPPISAAATSVPNGGAMTTSSTLPPYHRPFTPPGDIRPIRDERLASPAPTYPPQYHHAPPPPPPVSIVHSGISGPPPPQPSILAAAEPGPPAAAAAPPPPPVERDERPGSALKRVREWENAAEAGPSSKRFASEESRSRLDDRILRRATSPPPPPPPSSVELQQQQAAADAERRANEAYHPSETAHHPPTLPSIQNMQQPSSHPSLPPMESSSNGSIKSEQQQLALEPAARKMNVDENYDDEGDDEKKATTKGSSPVGGQAKLEP